MKQGRTQSIFTAPLNPSDSSAGYMEIIKIGTQKPYFAFSGHSDKNTAPFYRNLHLSDINGVPMHYLENAKYWAGLCGSNKITDAYVAKSQIEKAAERMGKGAAEVHAAMIALGIDKAPMEEYERYSDTPNAEHLASHLRIKVEKAQEWIDELSNPLYALNIQGDVRNLSKEGFIQYVEGQKPRWKQEADQTLRTMKKNVRKLFYRTIAINQTVEDDKGHKWRVIGVERSKGHINEHTAVALISELFCRGSVYELTSAHDEIRYGTQKVSDLKLWDKEVDNVQQLA